MTRVKTKDNKEICYECKSNNTLAIYTKENNINFVKIICRNCGHDDAELPSFNNFKCWNCHSKNVRLIFPKYNCLVDSSIHVGLKCNECYTEGTAWFGMTDWNFEDDFDKGVEKEYAK